MITKIKNVFSSLFFLTLICTYTTSALAGGGLVVLSSTSGQAGGSAAQVKATIFLDENHTQPAAGVTGSFTFDSAQNGQSCSTPNPVSNSQGEITGTCISSSTGSFVARFTNQGSDSQHTVVINFASPTPTPQVVSGSYKLEPSESTITFNNEINNGYGINVTLKDAKNGETIINQSDISYNWVSENTNIVKIYEINSNCISPVQPPCPRINAQLHGYNPGSTSIKVEAKKNGSTVAEARVNVAITQATTGTPRVTVTITPATASPTATPPSATATPTPKPTATPSPSPTPLASESPTPSPTADPTPTATPTTELEIQSDSNSGTQYLIWFLLISGVVVGVIIPIGWYLVMQNPKLVVKVKTFFKIK